MPLERDEAALKRANDIAAVIRHQSGLGQTPVIGSGYIDAVRNAPVHHEIGNLVAQYASPDELKQLPAWARLEHSIASPQAAPIAPYVNNVGAQQPMTMQPPFSYAPLQGSSQFYFQNPAQNPAQTGLLDFSGPQFDLPRYGLLNVQ